MTEQPTVLRPAEFCHQMLHALEASEGRTKRRKRDQTPDRIGLDLKRDLLRQAMEADPEPETFEAWLLERALQSPASGPVRALCALIFDEYRFASADQGFSRWLAQGAPSDDAEPDAARRDTPYCCELHRPEHERLERLVGP